MAVRYCGIGAAAALAAVICASCCKDSGADGKFAPAVFSADSAVQAKSYLLGRDMGGMVKNLDTEIDEKVFYAAISEVLHDVPSQLSDSTLKAIGEAFGAEQMEKRAKKDAEMKQKQEEMLKDMAGKNKVEGEEFLAKNKTEPGVVVTESGLQYIVITEGKGAKPTLDSRVKVNYHGTFLDGKVFDSSIERGKPAEFTVRDVILGWTEALQLMKVGGKIKVFIPSDLAYGDRGSGPVPPGSTLVFEIELLEVMK